MSTITDSKDVMFTAAVVVLSGRPGPGELPGWPGRKETRPYLNHGLVLCVIVGNGKRTVGMTMSGSEDATFR
jgi:hypothetical protein